MHYFCFLHVLYHLHVFNIHLHLFSMVDATIILNL